MKFRIGDSVKLRVQKKYDDGTVIPEHTPGLVELAHEISESYTVNFDGFKKNRRVPESDLLRDN
jgi:hypothetical protein